MADPFVQETAKATGSSVASLQTGAFGSSVTNGNTIIVLVAVYGNGGGSSISGVADTTGANTYVRDKSTPANSDSHNTAEVWRAHNVTGGSSFKVTVSFNTNSFVALNAIELAGDVTTIDVSSTGGPTSDNAPTQAAYSTTVSETWVATIATDAAGGTTTITEPTGYSKDFQETDGGSFVHSNGAHKYYSTTQTNIAPAFSSTASVSWVCLAVAYQVPGGGGGGPTPPVSRNTFIFQAVSNAANF